MAMAMSALSFLPATSISRSSPRRLPPLIVSCSAPAGKSRVRKKVMSDADLCKGLREFVLSVGFPDDHVPSTKELAEHGRKDLANIVRRRGYKFIRELLANDIEVGNKSDMERCLTEGQNLAHHFEHDATDEKKKVKDLAQESLESVEGVSSFVNGHLDDKYDISSLEKKVHKFLRYGSLDLDIIEGSREYTENSTASDSLNYDKRDSSVTRDRKDTMMLNGTAVMSKLIASSVPRNEMRDNDTSVDSPADSAIGRGMNLETSEMENQDEVERLKLMLQHKDLELSQLRELIEKEKETLFTLQSKAEEEINTAQKLISEMDAELLAAEESLTGLKEVKVQYNGEAQMVEIAGSFNGWHQPLKMDPHPDNAEDSTKSRNPRCWYTSLWLYPGEYEIKFIVDGKWRVDPEREIVTRSGNQNNILRVDG